MTMREMVTSKLGITFWQLWTFIIVKTTLRWTQIFANVRSLNLKSKHFSFICLPFIWQQPLAWSSSMHIFSGKLKHFWEKYHCSSNSLRVPLWSLLDLKWWNRKQYWCWTLMDDWCMQISYHILFLFANHWCYTTKGTLEAPCYGFTSAFWLNSRRGKHLDNNRQQGTVGSPWLTPCSLKIISWCLLPSKTRLPNTRMWLSASKK